MYKSFVLFFLLVIVIKVSAQYVKTDELIFLPGAEKPISIEEYVPFQDSLPELNMGYLAEFLVPGNGSYVISHYGPRSGRMHYGTDIKMNNGDTIVASQSGTIIRSDWGYGFGNLIVIQHEKNIQTYYAHLSKFLVKSGTWVTKGEPIGLAGSTGRAIGIHLHFEIHENEIAFDSELIFDFERQEIREDAHKIESLTALHNKLNPKAYSTNMALPEYYKVRSGDTLWAISRQYQTPINIICKLNNISESTTLQVGQPIKLY